MEKIFGKMKCPKCDNNEYEVGVSYFAGSFMAKLFDIQNRKLTSVTCTRCHYTEFYKVPVKNIQKVLDFMTG